MDAAVPLNYKTSMDQDSDAVISSETPRSGQSPGWRLLCILIVFLSASVGFAILTVGRQPALSALSVSSLKNPMYDMEVITAGAESIRQGKDPLVENPADRSGRTMNYPRVWQLVGPLGIDKSHTYLLGWLVIGAFLASVVLFFTEIRRVDAVLIAMVVFSPAVLLGMERANIDLLIFSILALALYLGRIGKWSASVGVLVGAVVLKLFPLFGVGYLLPNGRDAAGAKRRILAAVGLSIVYIALTYPDLALIRKATPSTPISSFGKDTLALIFADISQYPPVGDVVRLMTGILLGGIFLTAWVAFSNPVARSPETDANLPAFRAGAGIYLGVFLLGTNFNYRLMFLIFTIPFLTALCREPATQTRWLGRIGIALVVLASWAMQLVLMQDQSGVIPAIVWSEVVYWALFAAMAFLFMSTLPPGLLVYLRRPREMLARV